MTHYSPIQVQVTHKIPETLSSLTEILERAKRVTVFHELLHACRFIFQNDSPSKKMEYEEWEHHFISVWENPILMVLKENPELTQWLLEEN